MRTGRGEGREEGMVEDVTLQECGALCSVRCAEESPHEPLCYSVEHDVQDTLVLERNTSQAVQYTGLVLGVATTL